MMEQVRLCCLAYRELAWLAWLFLEPDAGLLDHCPRILLSCFRAKTSAYTHAHLSLG